MSFSPPISRFPPATSPGSNGSMKQQEELINAFEAEEERIINVLSRKLEQLREDKIDLENTLEAESESHVNRLQRELSSVKSAYQQLQAQIKNRDQQAGPSADVDLDLLDEGARKSARNGIGSTSVSRAGGNGNGHGRGHSGGMVDSPPPSVGVSPESRPGLGFRAYMTNGVSRGYNEPIEPTSEVMLDAMRRENEQLRNRLVDTERDYIRVSRLNEIYREELIDHRRRLGLSVDNLIGLASDPFSQPTHHRHSSSGNYNNFSSTSSSPSTSMFHIPRHGYGGGGVSGGYLSMSHYPSHHLHQHHQAPSTQQYHSHSQAGPVASTSTSHHQHYSTSNNGNGSSNSNSNSNSNLHSNGVPIPRPPSQIRRPKNIPLSESSTPLSHSPSSVSTTDSTFPFSPVTGSSSGPNYYHHNHHHTSSSTSTSDSNPSAANPASFVSVSTNLTSPTSGSFGQTMGMAYMTPGAQRTLTYPVVPPPSLSSSFGSPSIPFYNPSNGGRDASLSPIEPLSRRNSTSSGQQGPGPYASRRGSLAGGERRVVETGSLVRTSGPGSRRASFDRGGARVAETGSLAVGEGGRSRAGSQSVGGATTTTASGVAGPGTQSQQLPETVDEAEDGEGEDGEGEDGEGEGDVTLDGGETETTTTTTWGWPKSR